MFAKIFRQIFESSIAENPTVRFTFMDLLVLADPNGVVDMTHESIARITNRPIEEIRSTISHLEGPDPRSRTPDEDGARLRRLDEHRDWGWIIVNYDRFRDIASEEQRRERTRARVKALRSRRKEECNAPVTHGNAGNAMQKQKQKQRKKNKGESERFEKPEIQACLGYAKDIGMPEFDVQNFHDHFESNGWRVGGKSQMKDWKAAMRLWNRRRGDFAQVIKGRPQPEFRL